MLYIFLYVILKRKATYTRQRHT